MFRCAHCRTCHLQQCAQLDPIIRSIRWCHLESVRRENGGEGGVTNDDSGHDIDEDVL